MCSFTMVQIGLTIASGVAQYGSQVQAAKAQAQAQQQASRFELQRHQHAMTTARHKEAQEDAALAVEAGKGHKEAEEAIATTATAGEEGGVGGSAVGLSMADFARANAEYQSMLVLQEKMSDTASLLSFEGGGIQYQQNMLNINQPIDSPNPLGILLNVAQTGMGQYQAGQTRAMQRESMGMQRSLNASQLATSRAQLALTQAGSRNQLANLDLLRAQTGTERSRAALFDARRIQITPR